MTISENTELPYFEVGAVSKITGLSANTLRTWERRNFIQASSRSATGRRRYSQEQVEILALMKKLTGMGDAISYGCPYFTIRRASERLGFNSPCSVQICIRERGSPRYNRDCCGRANCGKQKNGDDSQPRKPKYADRHSV